MRDVSTDATHDAPLPGSIPAGQAALRRHNLALVAGAVAADDEPLSRGDIVARTGLGRATVTRLLQELRAARLVEDLERPGTDTRGRPATPVRLAGGTVAGLGLEVNVSYVAGRALDLAGHSLAEIRLEGDFAALPPADTLRRLGDAAASVVGRLRGDGVDVVGATLAVPGMTSADGTHVAVAPNLGWRDVRPLGLLGEAWAANGVPLRAHNDANLQSLAVAYGRPGRLDVPGAFLYLAGDVGIGASLVRGGALTEGEHGWAGEIGHTCVEPDGPVCHCGSTGCLETYAGQTRIMDAAGLPPLAGVAALLDALANGEPAAVAAVERAAWALGIAVANVLNFADVSQVVLGTSLGRLLPWLRPTLEAGLDRRVLAAGTRTLRLTQGTDFAAPACTGGAYAVLNALLASPADYPPLAAERGEGAPPQR